ncbi:MAG: hypothetical protein NTY45_13860 [Elusimicrobia bacterium]|nr:hypothetical protein [Elusimicrobiota bacterium]
MKNKILLLVSALLLGACSHAVRETVLNQPLPVVPPVEPPVPVLHRTYTEGEVLKYKLTLDYSETGEVLRLRQRRSYCEKKGRRSFI